MTPLLPAVLSIMLIGGGDADQPRRAAEMSDSLGVNVHIEYTDGGYRNLAQVLAALDYLGVRSVRDAAPNPSNQGQPGYLAMAKARVKFDLFLNGEEIEPALRRIANLERDVPGSVSSIEGVNEVNNHSGFRFGAEVDPHRAGRSYQARLYSLIKGDPTLSHIPIVAFTDYPYTAGPNDFSNDHPYPPGDAAPLQTLAATAGALIAHEPGHPILFTELGYPTSRGRPGVSELAQARLLLASLLDCATLGVRRTYIYQLLDAYPDTGGNDQEKHFGLFGLDYSPKPAARALRRFLLALQDSAPTAQSFLLRPLPSAWPQLPPDVHHLTFEKTNGEIVLALWRDVASYSFSTLNDVEVASTPVDITLPTPRGSVMITDPVAGTSGAVRPGARATRIQLGANPILVQIATASRDARSDE